MVWLFLVFIGIVILSVFLLRGFDRVAGRGPKQIKDGIESSNLSKVNRVPCPECAELIIPSAKKCHFCGAIIEQEKGTS